MTLFGDSRKLSKKYLIYKILFNKSPSGQLLIDGNKITLCNKKAVEIFNYGSKKSLLTTHLTSLLPKKQSNGLDSHERIRELFALAREHDHYQSEWEFQQQDGTIFYTHIELVAITLDSRNVIYATLNDITNTKSEQKQLAQQQEYLQHKANHDPLTNLPNRALMMDRLQHGIERAKRNRTVLSVLYLDLDNFKQINDTLGHDIGDAVLIEVAERLTSVVRKEDTLARIGGDEFIVITESSQTADTATQVAEKILEVLAEPIAAGSELYASCSIGISHFPRHGRSADDLLKCADSAMYNAKNRGRNRYQSYSPEMSQVTSKHFMSDGDFRSALEQKEFIPYYQPQFDLSTGVLVGMEALVRWLHPLKGTLTPNAFLPLAEESGLIKDMDSQMMTYTMKQMQIWHQRGLYPGRLSLNLSLSYLMNSNLIDNLIAMMEEIGCSPKRLELEVSEADIMKNPEALIEKLDQLKRMGITIAMDNYGIGCSSLAYLHRLPISRLKLDKSFVRGLPHNKENVAVIQATIAITRSLCVELVAEGVETKEQKEFLLESGCSIMQGYLFGKPTTAVKIEKGLLKMAD